MQKILLLKELGPMPLLTYYFFLTKSTHAEQHKLTVVADSPKWDQYG